MPDGSASLTRPRAAPRSSALPLLVAALTLATLELVRGSGPLVDRALTRTGVAGAAGTALATYLLPGVAAAVLLLLTRALVPGPAASRAAVVLGAVLLAVLRLALQGLRGQARFVLGLGAVAVAVAVLTLAVAVLAGRPGGARAAAGSVALGAAAAVGLQLALGTWDAVWRHTPLGWAVAGLVAAALAGSAARLSQEPAEPPTGVAGRLWALGPLLALASMMLANPAYAAAQSGLPLALAGPLHAAGLLLAAGVLLRGRPWRRGWAGVLLVLGATGGLVLGGVFPADAVVVLAALLGAQVAAVQLLAAALDPARGPTPQEPAGWAAAATASLVGVATIGPLLLYQLDYDVPLGVPNETVLVLTAAALGVARIRRAAVPTVAAPRTAVPGGVLAGSCAAVLVGSVVVGLGWLASRPGDATVSGAGTGVVLSWNLHYGVTPDGSVDLEAVARTIEAENPDAVLLQEVSRGWVQGGGADMATWLANRLGRRFAFAPAADRRFGNVILVRGDPVDVEVHPLPYGSGPQRRSAVSARVPLAGTTVQVTSLHLQHRPANTGTRVRELETLLDDLAVDAGPGAPSIVGGDLNAAAGDPEPALLTGAGFVSALDVVGDPRLLTGPGTASSRRIDWVFGRGVSFAEARVVGGARLSDHRPVVVRLAR